jgi:predicted HTH transcriptional regulator
MPDRYLLVEQWEEADLLGLPTEETDYYEYKSSKVPTAKLKEKTEIAASAFWNSGGGIFIAGVDDQGRIDGGIPETVGKQKIRDWADQVLSLVEPTGPYVIKTISRQNSNSLIRPDHVVLVISFGESFSGPHMAPDKKYYIRAGAHSGPASHYIVEAIRARRGLQKPLLRGVLRLHPQKPNIVQLAVLSMTFDRTLTIA